jgi:hypothetical protein
MARVLQTILGLIIIAIGFILVIGPFAFSPPVILFPSYGAFGLWGQVVVGAFVIVGGFENMAGH